MSKKEMLRAIHSQYNVVSANYDGFEYRLVLCPRYTPNTYVRIAGTQTDYDISFDSKKEITSEINEYDYEVLNRLGEYMKKRMKHFKDPFKYINGWV